MATKPTELKPLPESILTGTNPSLEQQVATEAGKVDLGNESGTTEGEELAELRARYAKANGRIARYQLQVVDLEQRLQKSGATNEARQFIMMGHILQGLSSRGLFDPDKLKLAQGSERNLMKHAAGLAELANFAAREKGF